MVVEAVPALVHALFRSFSDGRPDPLLVPGHPSDDLREELVCWFMDDPEPLQARSHLHTNGFYKFARPLPPAPEIQIRLHYWPAATSATWSSIHSHRWDFISLVLTGHLEERLYDYKPAATGGSAQLFDYEPHDLGRGGAEKAVPTERINLRLAAWHGREPGNLQVLAGHQLHQIRAQAGSTTLVLRGPTRFQRAKIAMPFGQRPQLAEHLVAMNPEKMSDVLAEVRGRCQPPRPSHLATRNGRGLRGWRKDSGHRPGGDPGAERAPD